MLVQLNFPRTFDNLFNEFIVGNPSVSTYPALDISENENETITVAELPGVKKENIKLNFEDGILTISGERQPFESSQNAQVLLNEIRVSEFKRSIEFPHEVDSNKISAELQNGLLRIVVPKAEAARARTIEVK